jgi:hypothetical protein
MKFFYLATKNNNDGQFEIHDRECPNIPNILERDYLGPFNNSMEAIRHAKLINPDAVMCKSCCKEVRKTLVVTTATY